MNSEVKERAFKRVQAPRDFIRANNRLEVMSNRRFLKAALKLVKIIHRSLNRYKCLSRSYAAKNKEIP